MEPTPRTKFFAVLFFILYGIGFSMIKEKPALAALCMVCSGGSLYLGTSPAERADKHLRNQSLFLAFAFYLPAAVFFVQSYMEHADERRFEAYLSAHTCKFVGVRLSGYTAGGCDDVGRCVDPAEIEEPEYYCRATGRRITPRQFADGGYGK